MTRRWVTRRPVRLLLAGLLLTACGVEPQSEPQPVPDNRLPSAAPSTSAPIAPARVRVWGVREQRLVPVFVELPTDGLAPRVRAMLALAESEQAATSIPRGTRLLSVTREGDVVQLVLSSAFMTTGEREVPLALAQLVFTVTEVPGAQRAHVRSVDRAIPLVDATGRVLERPLQRSDFAGLDEHATK